MHTETQHLEPESPDASSRDVSDKLLQTAEAAALERFDRTVDGSHWQTLSEGPDPEAIFQAALALDKQSFPPFLVENGSNIWFDWIIANFKEDGIVFLDPAGERVLAAGFSAPINLDGGIPENGWEGAIDKIITDYKNHTPPNALLAFSASVSPEARGQKMGDKILKALSQRAKEQGFSTLLVPVRPSDKEHYPDLSMEDYANKYDPASGEHADSWVRAHQRCGGQIIGIGRNSHVVRSPDGNWPSVQQWEAWTGMQFPADGTYDIPRGNAKLVIHDGIGEYSEDCVWVKYDLEDAAV